MERLNIYVWDLIFYFKGWIINQVETGLFMNTHQYLHYLSLSP